MARYKYQGTARDGNGRVIPGCTITVYLAGGTTLATCYEVETGGSAISGSQITASSTGGFSFWIDDGDYAFTQKFKVAISKANFNSVTYDSIGIIPSDTNDKVAVNSSETAGYLLDVISAGDGITVSESGGVAVVAVGASVLQNTNIGNTVQEYDPDILKADTADTIASGVGYGNTAANASNPPNPLAGQMQNFSLSTATEMNLMSNAGFVSLRTTGAYALTFASGWIVQGEYDSTNAKANVDCKFDGTDSWAWITNSND